MSTIVLARVPSSALALSPSLASPSPSPVSTSPLAAAVDDDRYRRR
jgi:hypothetical protein